jgi:hypothetical protein
MAHPLLVDVPQSHSPAGSLNEPAGEKPQINLFIRIAMQSGN